MSKRFLSFLSALLLFLLPAFSLADCTHADENGVPYGLVPRGYVAPQVGVPGYSGDQCCASCGAVLIRGSEIPALLPPPVVEEPAPREESPGQAEPPKQEEPPVEQPVVPAAEPQAPAAPPAQPESPVVPASQPVTQPEKPAETKVDTPAQPAEKQPETKQPEARTETAPAQLPAPPPEEKPAQAKPAEPKTPAKTPARTPGGGKTKGPVRERFSSKYPYRRVRMNPQPDILAEFAGVLIWPVAGTPFLNMLGD